MLYSDRYFWKVNENCCYCFNLQKRWSNNYKVVFVSWFFVPGLCISLFFFTRNTLRGPPPQPKLVPIILCREDFTLCCGDSPHNTKVSPQPCELRICVPTTLSLGTHGRARRPVVFRTSTKTGILAGRERESEGLSLQPRKRFSPHSTRLCCDAVKMEESFPFLFSSQYYICLQCHCQMPRLQPQSLPGFSSDMPISAMLLE